MEKETTQVKEPEKETQNEDSYEKRYKDSQAHITKLEQENATYRETAVKDKELFDTVSPHIDWDSINNPKNPAETTDDDGYVDKKTLNDQLSKMRTQIVEGQQLQYFRSKYPDLIEQEVIVSAFFGKTDPRRKFEERLKSAVDNTKTLLEAQRTQGIKDYEKEIKEKVSKEAEVSGLSEAKGPKGSEKESEGETYDDYVKSRKAQSLQAQGVSA